MTQPNPLVEALEKCQTQFTFYAEQHRAKATADGDHKARVNLDMVEMIAQALASHRAAFHSRQPNGNADGLMPCPFCRGAQIAVTPINQGDHLTWAAICKACGASLERDTEDEVTTAWNSRQPDTAPAEGFVCVPTDPTEAMIGACLKALPDWRKTLDADERMLRRDPERIQRNGKPFEASATPEEKARLRYRAMIAAAPKPGDASEQG